MYSKSRKGLKDSSTQCNLTFSTGTSTLRKHESRSCAALYQNTEVTSLLHGIIQPANHSKSRISTDVTGLSIGPARRNDLLQHETDLTCEEILYNKPVKKGQISTNSPLELKKDDTDRNTPLEGTILEASQKVTKVPSNLFRISDIITKQSGACNQNDRQFRRAGPPSEL